MPIITNAPETRLPRLLEHAARWFFVRNEQKSETTKLVREALLELDITGMLTFKKD